MFWYSIRFINARSRSNYGNHWIPESVKLLLVESGIPEHFAWGIRGAIHLNQNCRKFRSKTQWIGSIQLEKSRKTSPFPVGILVEWIAPLNTAQGIRNPTKDWNPESKFHWQKLESSIPGIRNPRRGNPESKTVLDLSAERQLQTHAIAVFYRHSCILFLLPEHYHQHWNERGLMSDISSKPRWLGI